MTTKRPVTETTDYAGDDPARRESGVERAADLAPVSAPGQADRIAYLVDMILELQEMAEASGCKTLAGILSLAHVEASHQRKTARA